MKASSFIKIVVLAWGLVLPNWSNAITPPWPIPDQELAAYPIVVVAKWDKSPFKALNQHDYYTKLDVIRVIQGKLETGVATLKVQGLGWSNDGKLASYTNDSGGEMDITVPCLWFLKKERSWDPSDQQEYLSINNGWAIQPVSLEKYFTILCGSHPETQVPALLASQDPEVIRRTLLYMCGGNVPWLYDDDLFDMHPKYPGKLLIDEADSITNLFKGRDVDDLRALAVTVYAELKGKRSVEDVRKLLTDDDIIVRAMAVGVLAQNRDEQSIASMIQAVNGITNSWAACKIIESIRQWGDSRLSAALISYLENNEEPAVLGDNYYVPAIKARDALREMTGYVFPYEVKSSLEAWKKAQSISNTTKRNQLLAGLIPCEATPLKIEVIGTNKQALLRVTNSSKQPVTITKDLTSWEQRSPSGSWGRGGFDSTAPVLKDDFVTLQPGQSLPIKIELEDRFLLDAPETRSISVVFSENGHQVGVHAWIGLIHAEFGNDWHEERKLEKVTEKWSNGNLKEIGQTINGEKVGSWEYFNEAGDRTKIVSYTGGSGTTIFNPEHPDNKGAGKKAVRQ